MCRYFFLHPWFLFLDTVVLFIYNIGLWPRRHCPRAVPEDAAPGPAIEDGGEVSTGPDMVTRTGVR